MIIHDFDQRSPGWVAARLGKATGSAAPDVVSKGRGNAPSLGMIKMVSRLVGERLTRKVVETFQSQAMLDGIEREAAALLEYQAFSGEMVDPCGFVSLEGIEAGCSPDGVVGDFEGIVEAKSPMLHTHLSYIYTGVVPADYSAQCLHALWITGANWCDWFSYQPDLPANRRIICVRIERDEAAIKDYETKVLALLKEVDEKVALLSSDIKTADIAKRLKETA